MYEWRGAICLKSSLVAPLTIGTVPLKQKWSVKINLWICPSITECYGFYYATIIAYILYLPSCLVQETAKQAVGPPVKVPPAHLSTTHGGGFALLALTLNIKHKNFERQLREQMFYLPELWSIINDNVQGLLLFQKKKITAAVSANNVRYIVMCQQCTILLKIG